MTIKNYEIKTIKDLINRYINAGGDISVINEGCLLDYGMAILTGEGLKTFIIREKYLNEWSSCYTLQAFNKTPKKYLKLLEVC